MASPLSLLPPNFLSSKSYPTLPSPSPSPSPPPHYPFSPPSLNLSHLIHLSIQAQDLNFAKSIHTFVAKSHLYQNTKPKNSLISMYAKLNKLDYARRVFDQLSRPDVASFTSLISAYAKTGRELDAIFLFDAMRQTGIDPNEYTYVGLLTSCIRMCDFDLGSQIHAVLLKTCYLDSVYVVNALIGVYVSCGFSDYAQKVFDEMSVKDVSSWNAIILAMVKDCRYEEAFELFKDMKMEGEFGDGFSISTLLTAVNEGFSLKEGELIHAYAMKLGLDSKLSVGNALVKFYTNFGNIDNVIGVFDRMVDKDVISWTGMLNAYMEFGFVESGVDIFNKMPKKNIVSYNSLLAGFCKNGEGTRSLKFFHQMLKDGVEISDFTITSVVNACAMIKDKKNSSQVHGLVIKMGFLWNAWIEAALLDMCSKCGRMEDAEKIYEQKIQKGSFPLTWNALINARARNGQFEEALSLFRSGLKRDDMMSIIDEFTLATFLGICGTLGFLELGEQIHAFALKSNAMHDIGVSNAIVSMYSKCGYLDKSINFFTQMHRFDLVSYNALITSYLLHRKGDEALNVWFDMEKSGKKPDQVTFLLIISSCKYTKVQSLDTCKKLFTLMTNSYNLEPSSEHYASMVDVMSYLGHFKEAMEFIESMSLKPDAIVWRALLDNCMSKSKFNLAKQAMQKIVALEPNDVSSYILVSNIYSSSGRWHCSDKVREEMKKGGLKKNPSKSFIVHGNVVHSFFNRDRSHYDSKDIYSGLEVLILEAMKNGYEPNTSYVLHEVGEVQKRNFLYYHSIKLAVAFGILVSSGGEVVRVVKNVRMCGDCHEFLKVVSMVTRRKILVRDGSGFHRFEFGECLCGD